MRWRHPITQNAHNNNATRTTMWETKTLLIIWINLQRRINNGSSLCWISREFCRRQRTQTHASIKIECNHILDCIRHMPAHHIWELSLSASSRRCPITKFEFICIEIVLDWAIFSTFIYLFCVCTDGLIYTKPNIICCERSCVAAIDSLPFSFVEIAKKNQQHATMFVYSLCYNKIVSCASEFVRLTEMISIAVWWMKPFFETYVDVECMTFIQDFSSIHFIPLRVRVWVLEQKQRTYICMHHMRALWCIQSSNAIKYS